MAELREAKYRGDVKIGSLALPCRVLSDGTHVFSERAMFGILNIKGKGGRKGKEGKHRITSILGKDYIRPFIDKDIWADIEKPIRYLEDNKEFVGYKSSVLGGVVKGLLQANKAAAFETDDEKKYVEKVEVLRDALVNVAIDTPIDEATGYQEVRDRNALDAILDKYLRKDLAAWSKKFPDEFYKEIFRLKGWKWEGMQLNRPSIVGTYTNDIVYERLAPGVIDELEKRNPVTERGCRKHKHHQWFTDDIGHPKLRDHLIAVIAIMRTASNWNAFKRALEKSFPKIGDQLELLDEADNDNDNENV